MSPAPIDLLLRIRAAGAQATAAQIDRVSGATNRLNASTKAAGKSMISTGRHVRMLGSEMTQGLTLPLVGIGYAAVKAQKSFEAAMTRVGTQAGASKQEVALFSREILRMTAAGQVAQTPTELAEGMFSLASIGLKPAKALEALRVAAEGAAVGGADLRQTTDALGGAVVSGIKGTGSFSHMMAVMNATVGAGNLTMQELVHGLGTGILPAARMAGLSLTDIMGSMALFTDETYQGSSAMAQLATALHYIYAPTDKGEKALKRMGLSGHRMAVALNSPRGLLGALTLLRDHLRATAGVTEGPLAARALAPLLPGGRGRILLSLINNLDRYEGKMNRVEATTKNMGDAVRRTKQTMEYQFHRAISQVTSALILLGEAIQPVLIPILRWLAQAVSDAAHWFSSLDKSTKQTIVIIGIALAVLGPLVTIIGVLIMAGGALITVLGAMMSPWTIVIGLLVLAYMKVGWFRSAVNWLAKALWYLVKNGIGLLINSLKALPGVVAGVGRGLWNGLKAGLQGTINWIIGKLNWLIRAFNNTVAKMPGIGEIGQIGLVGQGGGRLSQRGIDRNTAAYGRGSGVTPAGHMARGGMVRKSGVYEVGERGRERVWLPAGAGVEPNGASMVLEAPITVMMPDGQVLARAVHRAAVRKKSVR